MIEAVCIEWFGAILTPLLCLGKLSSDNSDDGDYHAYAENDFDNDEDQDYYEDEQD